MTTLPWGRYEELRPSQISSILETCPIAYLPWGALEWHSYHAPIGLDSIKAHGLCESLASETGGVVLPAVYVGTETIKPFKGFPHSIEHAKETVTLLCDEFLQQLAEEGFKIIILLSGHHSGAHMKALGKSAENFRAKNSNVGLWFLAETEALNGEYSGDHAARVETSFQLHFQPDLVDLQALPADRETTLDEDGVWGEDPRLATAQQGVQMVALFKTQALNKIQSMIAEYL